MELFGIPVHPLVVHAAVVVVPLVALGTLIVAFWEKARRRFGWLLTVFSVGAVGSTILAAVSGQELFESLGEDPSSTLKGHMSWGKVAFWPALAMAVALVAMMLTTRGRDPEQRPPRLYWVMAVIAASAAVASLVLIMMVGHSGATAVWTE